MSVQPSELSTMRRLRVMALIEGTTLVGLVFVAMPLKHLLGQPLAVHVMGPVHGIAFVAYIWSLISAAAGGGWARREIARLAVGALIPFASFLNERWLRMKEAQIFSADNR